MRDALANIMPQVILSRRSKLGFGGTFSSWISDLDSQFEKWLCSRTLEIDPYVSRTVLWEQLRTRSSDKKSR